MRKVLARVGMTSMVAASFAIGVVAAVARGWGDNSVAVTVVNDTNQPITELMIRHESCHGTGTLHIGAIDAGGSRSAKISMCGNGAFSVQAKLSSGAAVNGQELYVETHRRYRQVVTVAGVLTEDEYAL